MRWKYTKRQHVLWNYLRSINVNIFDLLSDDMVADAEVLVYILLYYAYIYTKRMSVCSFVDMCVPSVLSHSVENIEFRLVKSWLLCASVSVLVGKYDSE